MAITAYKILKAPLNAIGGLIATAIGDDWQPFGSPALLFPQDKEIYQALVKGAPDEGEVTEYKVVRSPIDAIEAVVEEAIADDWQPFGSPAFLYPQDKEVYQALVKIAVVP